MLSLSTNKELRALVVTTGTESYILNTYLPSLRKRGEYKGDILIVDYEGISNSFSLKNISNIEGQNILYRKIKPLYSCLASDRMRAFYECLKDLYQNYDVIMCTDGNDIEYFMSIQPLLDIAKDIFCYVIETPAHLVRNWIRFSGFPDADIVWKSMKDKPMINAGMIAGPSDKIFEVLKFMTEQMKSNSKDNGFGADQLLLNALIYYYNFPSLSVGYEWNYVLLTNHRRQVAPISGRVFAKEDGREIAIIHRNGQGHMDFAIWKKMVFPACRMTGEGWMHRKEVVKKEFVEKRIVAQVPTELDLMYKLMSKASIVKGDMAEVGVWKGGSAKFICEFKGNKNLHLFDTFEGMPETRPDDIIAPYGRYKEPRQIIKGEMVRGIEEAQENLKKYSNVFFYKGIFPETSDSIKDTKFSFVHLDVDIYKSTIDALNFFYPRMNKGGVILIHDYVMCTGIKKSVEEFLLDKPERYIAVGNQCYIVKDTIINLNLEDLVIYPYWNENIHTEIDPLVWFKAEYPNLGEVYTKIKKDIAQNGIKETLLVEKLFDGKYGVVDGNHRFYLALQLNLKKPIPCEIITPLRKMEVIKIQHLLGKESLKKAFDKFGKWHYIDCTNMKPHENILRIVPYFDMKGKRVLELGPFEGRDTYSLEYIGAREVISIEGRIENYLKFNVVKFFFLNVTTPIYGDIEKIDLKKFGYFDFCLARGILHYQTNPVKIFRQLSEITDNLWLGIRLASKDFPRTAEVECEGYKGRTISCSYDNVFSGLQKYAIWLYKEELLRLLKNLGYSSITIVKEPDVYNEKGNTAEIYVRK